MMKVVFMGTPEFSVPALDALIEAGHEILAVVTQPDKPKGRGKAVAMSPVKERALELGIPVYQPVRIKKEPEFTEQMKALNPDVMVVIAFGQILPAQVLEIPRYGCVNIHASLLPKYRGAAPIQWAVIDGEKETGVTTMMMDVGLDTGDMLDKTVVSLDAAETGGSLHDKLSRAGAKLITETLEKLEQGTAVRTPQTEEGSSYAGMLTKELGDLDWSRPAAELERLVRGLNPWPSAYTRLNGKTLKLWETVTAPEEPGETGFEPGQVTKTDRETLWVQTGDGLLGIRRLQLEGKKQMDTAAFLRGFQVLPGTRLG